MNIRRNKKSIVFSNIMNDGLLVLITEATKISNSSVEITEFSTKAKVTGNLPEFVMAYKKVCK